MSEQKGVKARLSNYLKVLANGGSEQKKPEHFEAGLAAFERGDVATATMQLTMGLVEEPTHVKARVTLARIALGARQFKPAEDHALALIQHHRSDPVGHSLLGEVLHAQRRYDRAASSYQAAIGLAPKFVDAHVRLGILQFEQGDMQLALKTLEKAIFLDSRDANARYYIAQICLEYEDFKRALIQSHWAEKIDPSFRPVYLLRADIFEHLGDWRNASGEFNKLQDLGLADVEVHLRQGLAQLKMEHLELAQVSFEAAIGLEPRCWEARMNLAKIHEDLDHLDIALSGYRLLVGVKTYAEQARAGIDRIEERLGIVADAMTGLPEPGPDPDAFPESAPLPEPPTAPPVDAVASSGPAPRAGGGKTTPQLPGGKPKLADLVGKKPGSSPLPPKPTGPARVPLPPPPAPKAAPAPEPAPPPAAEAAPQDARNQMLQMQLVMAMFMELANQPQGEEAPEGEG